MSDADDKLTIRLEASLTRMLGEFRRGRQAAEENANAIQARFDRLNKAMAEGSATAGAKITRELDKLRAKYDPLYASSQRYGRDLERLNTAHRVGALTAAQYEAALERLNTEFAASTGAAQLSVGRMNGMTAAAGGLSGALTRNSFVINNAANQVGDFAVQVASGTAASRAFAQQAPQLIGAFGSLGGKFGALAGILGAVVAIGVPLIAMLANSEDEAQSLEDRLDTLRSAVDDYRTSAERARLPTAELAERYGTATGAAREFLAALVDINQVTALEGLRATLSAIATQFGEFQTSIGDGEFIVSPFEQTVARIRSELGIIARQDAPAVATALQRMSEAASPTEAVEASRALLDLLERTLGPYESMNDEARALYQAVSEAGDRAAELKAAAEGAGSAIGGAAGQAARLADELKRAVDAALDLASASVTDLRRAQIEYDFRDDPVGRAGALAGAQFDAETGSARGVDSTITAVLERQRRAAVENAEAVADLNERTREWRELQRDNERGGARQGRQEEAFVRSMAEQIEAAELELDMVGRTASQVAELTARHELLNEARRRGLDLSARSAETGETLAEQIDRQAAAIGRLSEAQAQASDRAQFFDDIQADLKNGILDAIVAGEDLAGTLENVARALARAALEAALFGSGPLAGLFGRSGGGGILSAVAGLFGGGAKVMHSGGMVGAAGVTRSVHPAIFAGAQRFHNGGWPGLRPGEVPAILERGERVLSRAEVASGGSGGQTVQIFNSTGQQARVESGQGPDGRDLLRIFVGEDIARGRFDKQMKGRFGTGNTGVVR